MEGHPQESQKENRRFEWTAASRLTKKHITKTSPIKKHQGRFVSLFDESKNNFDNIE